MDRERHRCAHTGALHALIVVEGTPLGTAVDELFVKDKPAALAYEFGTLVVVDELAAAALGTDGLDSLLGTLLLGLFNLLLPSLLQGLTLQLQLFQFFNFCHRLYTYFAKIFSPTCTEQPL